MAKNGKIAGSQIICLLFLCRVFSTMIFVPQQGYAAEGSTAILGVLIALGVQLLIFIPAYLFMKSGGNRDLVSTAFLLSPGWGRVAAVVLWVFSIFMCINVTANFDFFLVSTVYPQQPEWIILVLFIAAISYATFLGLESFARFGTVLIVVYLAANLWAGISLSGQYDMLNLRSPFAQGLKPLLRATLNSVAVQSETVAILMIAPTVKSGIKKTYVWTCVLGTLGVEIINLMTLLVLGDYAKTQTYPIYALFSVARYPMFHMTLWLFIAFLKASLYLYLAGECLQKLFESQQSWWTLLANGLLVFFISGLVIFQVRNFDFARWVTLSALPITVAAILLPILLLIISKAKKKTATRG